LGVLAAVFAETGLLVGFFLPGDSLLFTAGLFAARPSPFAPLWLLLVLVTVAAIEGDQVGYLIGKRAGRAIFQRPDSRLFKQSYVERSRAYFERYGARAVLLGRLALNGRAVFGDSTDSTQDVTVFGGGGPGASVRHRRTRTHRRVRWRSGCVR